jgi:peroxiredoxin Q/BCP
VLIGASADAVEKQAKFRDKHRLNMPLLADTEKDVAARYGVYKEKSLYGKIGMGLERTTFIIGKDGVIKKIFQKVKVEGHVEEVLQALDAIN